MKKKSVSANTVVLFLRVPADWIGRLDKIAQAEMRTRASVAKQAIKEFLERREK